jgi:hypothetical protein
MLHRRAVRTYRVCRHRRKLANEGPPRTQELNRIASAGVALSGVQYHIFSNRNIGAKLGSIVTRATGSTGRGSSELIR